MTTQKVPNRLAKEKSPYLLQHAHNSVNWFLYVRKGTLWLINNALIVKSC
ncbi:DUF255 domain-containing protein [Paenibacillus terrigena]|nr:DUF255 domain-containing protein [Paenibacillus terrigena]